MLTPSSEKWQRSATARGSGQVSRYIRAPVSASRVIIHSGARIGCDGFGYVFRDGAHNKIPHVGRCIIGDDVEIGANTTIDRGSIDDTVIGSGTKIDNLVHIAHNVRIGEKCLIMAQVGVAGSVTIGDGAILAGQAGISGHLSIGAGARLAAQAGVFGDIPAGETWSGYPARPHRESLRASAALFKLAGMMRRPGEAAGRLGSEVSRKTLARPAMLEGIGLHLGVRAKSPFSPRPRSREFCFGALTARGCPRIRAHVSEGQRQRAEHSAGQGRIRGAHSGARSGRGDGAWDRRRHHRHGWA